ncbi:hypothetical protein VOLCADRAFT_120723 [Volvox carteri f. nagariensis]|uniref:AMP-dependent synthetase/ligase domain-containing protein n=1 Tax=Volvox carteri f. nagariensis TaxID=3068 RepID=D8TS64_VOLCA|nr:uncharacterized protein VOLCADRAFT_120723 [Volvox carteri f. nagariensis]EFJ49638.1 hypothetical protein VOLCADRAFT_120723 [Volvox carteri f. nagariensis]|eukprot:XP_002949145.1 hypothetical protein VOLCADRAFT_120723 [Volvox carteri f. nagariensis]
MPSRWSRNADQYGSLVAVRDPHQDGSPEMTFRHLYDTMQSFAAGFHELGVAKHDKVALFSENSSRWLVADGAIMACGAAGVVRGASAPAEELLYIAKHSGAVGLVVQDGAALGKLLAAGQAHERAQEPNPLRALRFVVLLWGEAEPAHVSSLTCPLLSYNDVLRRGEASLKAGSFSPAEVSPDDLATLVYTSGTTGHPKGVMLTHGNLTYQVRNLSYFLAVQPGDRVLSLLPPWHIYERTCSYFVLSRGGQQVYTNIRRLRDDLTAFTPDHFVCVPLVLDTLHARVRQRLAAGPRHRAAIATALLAAGAAYHALPPADRGTSDGLVATAAGLARRWAQILGAAVLAALLTPLHWLASKLVYGKIREALGIRKTVVSGGGSLAAHLDDFYEALGLPVLNGWGLTETSPVLACRRSDPPEQNIRGSVGVPTPGTQLRVVDPETLDPLPEGRQGLVLANGPGVMAGYFLDEEATARAFRAGDGWFDTGDLGWVAPTGVTGSRCAGHLVLTGRAKDTIVLSSGKNVEPQPIEDAVAASGLIKHVVLVGQDKRELGALVWPDEDALSATPENSLSPAELEDRLLDEVARLNSSRPDYHHFEHVAHITVVRTPLSVDDGTLTRTMKPRRPEIMKRHAATAEALLARLRG